MDELYEHAALSDEDKVNLAKMMIRMRDLCKEKQTELNKSTDQKKYIENLSDGTKEKIEKQVQMYKDCRCFFRDYVYNK